MPQKKWKFINQHFKEHYFSDNEKLTKAIILGKAIRINGGKYKIPKKK